MLLAPLAGTGARKPAFHTLRSALGYRTNEEGTSINLGRRKRAREEESREEGGDVPFKRNEGRKASSVRRPTVRPSAH